MVTGYAKRNEISSLRQQKEIQIFGGLSHLTHMKINQHKREAN